MNQNQETQYSRCAKCGNRRPKSKMVQYKLQSFCMDNDVKDKIFKYRPSCYMAEFLKDLELKQHLERELK